MARPKKPIDVEQLKKCAEKQWSNVEIAAFFKVNVATLNRRFVDVIDSARHNGRAKLRDLQWARAIKGSDRMIIHMSKHYLGQHDRQDVNIHDAKTFTDVIESPDGRVSEQSYSEEIPS